MSLTRSIVVLLGFLLVTGLVPTAGLATHEAEKPVETQQQFRVDLGDDVYGNENVHYPGETEGTVILYITGAPEEFKLSYLVAYSPLNTTGCETTDISAGGIDRGNDDQYTKTDKSLIGAYEGRGNTTSENGDLGPADDPGPIAPDGHDYRSQSYIDFWEDEDFGGDATTFSPDDEGIIALKDCIRGPTVPGWYRGWGKVNGTSTETGELVSTTAFSNWNYICECDSYDQAIQTIGEPPAGYTVEEGETTGGDGDSGGETPTPTPTATSTATATTTATTTPTPTETVTTTAPTTESAAPTETDVVDGGTEATDGGGPGFGIVVALLALVGVTLLARGRLG